MAKFFPLPAYYILTFIINRLMSIIGKLRPWSTTSLSHDLLTLETATKIHFDPEAIRIASSDFGKMVQETPVAVLSPSTVSDIADMIKLSYNSSAPFNIAARGRGHSVRGQAMSRNGIVVDMSALSNINRRSVNVSWSPALGHYADVGGEQLWIDVLRTTLEHGLAPVSWTDYLYLTVGGTLSNAGISGQSFRYGPQISKVHEMDVITGKGELMTCSKHMNSELFYGVLGGLGQFGVITRARIVLDKAPTKVKWVRMLYEDFSIFTRDQEYLISKHDGLLEYLEGSLIMQQSPPNNWRSSFFSPSDQSKISSLLSKQGIIYCLEVVKYYDDQTADTVDNELDDLLQGLNYIPEFNFKKDEFFEDFLNRVRSGELKLQSMGLWEVPHPWLNLFVPKSRIMDFNAGVFVNILLKLGLPTGPILVYPMARNKWDDQMSAVTPDEDIFYSVGLLQSGGDDNWRVLEDQNQQILDFCNKAGIKIKQYLPHYKTREEWINHFGPKWNTFAERKARFDPKKILSPGQKIFN